MRLRGQQRGAFLREGLALVGEPRPLALEPRLALGGFPARSRLPFVTFSLVALLVFALVPGGSLPLVGVASGGSLPLFAVPARFVFLALAALFKLVGVASLALQQRRLFREEACLPLAQLLGASQLFREKPLPLSAALLLFLALAAFALFSLFSLPPLALLSFASLPRFPFLALASLFRLTLGLALLLFLSLAGGRVGERGERCQRESGQDQENRASVHGVFFTRARGGRLQGLR